MLKDSELSRVWHSKMGAAVGAQDYTVSFHFKWNPGKLKEGSSYNFFFFFLLNKKHKLHTQLMQNLNKLKYAFRDPQKGLRVARGQSKVLRNIFKDVQPWQLPREIPNSAKHISRHHIQKWTVRSTATFGT